MHLSAIADYAAMHCLQGDLAFTVRGTPFYLTRQQVAALPPAEFSEVGPVLFFPQFCFLYSGPWCFLGWYHHMPVTCLQSYIAQPLCTVRLFIFLNDSHLAVRMTFISTDTSAWLGSTLPCSNQMYGRPQEHHSDLHLVCHLWLQLWKEYHLEGARLLIDARGDPNSAPAKRLGQLMKETGLLKYCIILSDPGDHPAPCSAQI